MLKPQEIVHREIIQPSSLFFPGSHYGKPHISMSEGTAVQKNYMLCSLERDVLHWVKYRKWRYHLWPLRFPSHLFLCCATTAKKWEPYVTLLFTYSRNNPVFLPLHIHYDVPHCLRSQALQRIPNTDGG